jgi:hypothetical protein
VGAGGQGPIITGLSKWSHFLCILWFSASSDIILFYKRHVCVSVCVCV